MSGSRLTFTAVLLLAMLAFAGRTFGQSKERARDLGIPFDGTPGPLNAITDVAGVRVGHVTLIEGDNIRTGVTAVVPAAGNLFQEKVPGAKTIEKAAGPPSSGW